MKLLVVVLVLPLSLLFFSGCGGDDGGVGGSVDPSDVSNEDLYGYWVADPLPDEEAQPRRIFGFVRSEDADYELPLAENDLDPMGSPVGAVYTAPSPWSPGSIQQITTFQTRGGSILQTVLADFRALPGMMYATAIQSFKRGLSLVLESDTASTGSREYRYYERCPANTPTGWYQYKGQACTTYVSTGTSLAIDAEGGVHAASGVGAGDDPYCPPVPTFTDIHPRGCTARESETPNILSASAMLVGADGVLREVLLLETLASDPSYAENRNRLFLRERDIEGTEWTERKVSDEVLNVAEVRLLEHNDERVIVTEGVLDILTYRDNGTTFEKTDIHLGDDELDGHLVDAVMTPSGELVIAVDRAPSIYKQDGDSFTAIDAPEGLDLRGVLDVHVDSTGRIHAIFPGSDVAGGPNNMVVGRSATYGILDGNTWTTYPLGLIERAYIVSQADVLQVVVLTEKAARSALALLTIDTEGVVTSQLIDDREALGLGGSAPTFADPAAAIGPDGTIAATFDGSLIWVKHPDAPFEPQPYQAEFAFSGTGQARITSSDGIVDCEETCTIDTHVGTRFFVEATAEPGTAVHLGWCPALHQELFGGCWADVRVANNPLAPDIRHAIFTVTARPSAIYGRVFLSDGTNRNATAFATRDEHLALALAFNPGYGDFPIDGETLDTGDTQQIGGVAVYNRATKQGVAVKLPLQPSDVAVRADGGVQFVLTLVQYQYEIDGVSVGPGTVFGTMTPEGVIEVREVDATVIAAIVDGTREIALARDYDGHAYALLVDDLVVPLDFDTPIGDATLLADGDDVIVYAADRLMRVRGTTVTMSSPLTGVQFNAIAARNGRIVARHRGSGFSPDFGDGPVPDGSYIVEYRDGFTVHAVEEVPGLIAATTGDRNDVLAVTDTGATLIVYDNYYEFDEDMQTTLQTTFDATLGSILDSEATARGVQLLTYEGLIDIGPPAR